MSTKIGFRLLAAVLLLAAACDKAPEVIPVASVSVRPDALSLTEGETGKLTATVSPENATDKTVTWSTSDATVATVNGGTVTAVKAGSAVITAESGGKKATCTVTVSPKVYSVTGVTLDINKLEDLFDGEERTLKATVLPENATDKRVTWASSDDKVSTVDQNGKVTAVYTGTATITVTTADGGKQASCTVTVKGRPREVRLDKPTLDITEGETAALSATVLPENAYDKTVTWGTSDAAVATVAPDGTVTAVAAGTATITATAGTASAQCAVTVHHKRIVIYIFNKSGYTPLYLYAWTQDATLDWPGITPDGTEEIQGVTYLKFTLPETLYGDVSFFIHDMADLHTPDYKPETAAGPPYYCLLRSTGLVAIDPATFDPTTSGGTEGYGNGNEYGEGSF